MSRLPRSVGALLLAIVVCAGASPGPAFGDTPPPTEPTATEPTPAPAPPEPATPDTTTTEPTTTEPATTEPATTEPSVPEPERANPAAEPANIDLAIAVVFDKPRFYVGETITGRVTVTNNGTVAASRVLLDSSGNLKSIQWSTFEPPGVPIEPGQTVEGAFYATTNGGVDEEHLATLVVTATSVDEQEANPADNTTTVTVPVVFDRGGYRGLVYADRNGNQAKDDGEELVGLTVSVGAESPHRTYTTTTDSVGRFAFVGLPSGTYWIDFEPKEWAFPSVYVRVGSDQDPDLVFRGVHWIASVITASAAFTQPTYKVNDNAFLRLTLTNSGPVPISGIGASCYSTGANPVDVGALDPNGPGGTVPANGSRAFDVPIFMDGASADRGYQQVSCRFGVPLYRNEGPTASAVARILGARAAEVGGRLALELPMWPLGTLGGPRVGAPVPDAVIYLKDQVTGAVIARATTDVGGVFRFLDVPAGLHDVGVVGPWRITYGSDFVVKGSEDGSVRSHLVLVLPGPDQPDPGPVLRPAPQPEPAPQPGSGPRPEPGPGPGPLLAATGANIAWLALGGLLTLLAGIGLVVRAGRRQT